MLGASPMWAEYDVAFHLLTTASLYQVQSDRRDAAQMDDQAAPYYEDLVEHNPSVATFDQDLVEDFQGRVNAPEHENDRTKRRPGRKTPWPSGFGKSIFIQTSPNCGNLPPTRSRPTPKSPNGSLSQPPRSRSSLSATHGYVPSDRNGRAGNPAPLYNVAGGSSDRQ